MSLTTFLRGRSEKERKFQTIIKKIEPDKSEFKTLSNKGPFSDEFIIKVPNRLKMSKDSMIVGTTFDYLARFRIAQKIENDEKDTCYRRIVAENFFWRFSLGDYRNVLRRKFYEGIDCVIKFIYSNQSISKDLIHYAYFFGRLEQCWRCGRLIENIDELLDPPSKEIEDDLINLMSVFEDSFLNKVVSINSNVIFNPSFGNCSSVVRGADGDVFIDGVLYDFKTTKYNYYNSKDIQQIISYYLFNRINIKFYDTSSSFVSHDYDCTNIDRISIYLARYGEINYLDMKSINSELIERSIEDILELFKGDFMSFSHDYIIREYFKDKSTSQYMKIINEIKEEKLLESNKQEALLKLKKEKQEELLRLKKEKQEKEEKRAQSLKYRQDEIVMITESGTTFHTNEKCWTLRNSKSIKKVTIKDAIKQGKEKECKLCY